jgi:hypothetical protein
MHTDFFKTKILLVLVLVLVLEKSWLTTLQNALGSVAAKQLKIKRHGPRKPN